MKGSPILHPFLLSVVPLLFLFAHNLKRFPLSLEELFIPVAASLVLCSVLFLAAQGVLKDPHKSGLAVSVFFFSLYLYGPVHNAVRYALFGFWNDVLFLLCGIFWVALIWKIASSIKNWERPTKTLNAVGLILLVLNCASIVHLLQQNSRKAVRHAVVSQEIKEGSPDIYFIILDGYARADVLRDIYLFDNSEFIEFLTRNGFFVADESRANYSQSSLCLASTLNLNYLDELLPPRLSNSSNRAPLLELINRSAAVERLRSRDYRIVSFASGYFGTELKEVDIYLDSNRSLSEFQKLIIRTTPLELVARAFKGKPDLEKHRDRVLNALERLPFIKRGPAPLFVVAHILAPHPPFIFDEQGKSADLSGFFLFSDGSHYHRMGPDQIRQYIEDYRKQTIFITRRIMAVITELLSRPEAKPVIILQSDHGPGAYLHWENPYKTNLRERMSILNAIYFPTQNYRELSERTTPVNTFRVVFNEVFSEGYGLLPDRIFFSTWSRPYEFYEVDEFFRAHREAQALR